MSSVLNLLQEHQMMMIKLESLVPAIENIAKRIAVTLQKGGKVFLMGNGGSAADAQHIAAELVGRFKAERRGLAAIALTTDTSILTSVGNDYGYNCIFSRQLEALCQPNDVVIGISTSGNSSNVLKGLEVAKEIGAYTIGWTGESGGKLAQVCDDCFCVPSANVARIQEAHIFIGHSICECVENIIISEQACLKSVAT